VNLFLTWLPALLLSLLAAEAAWLRWALGRWPKVYSDEALGLVGTLLDVATSWLLIGVVFGLPLWLVSLIPLGFGRGWREVARRGAIVGIAILSLIALVVVDPFRFATWWLD
jgi:hypothetical protein